MAKDGSVCTFIRKGMALVCSVLFFAFLFVSCDTESDEDSGLHAAYGQNVRGVWPTCYVLEGENSLNIRTSPSLHKWRRKRVRVDNIAFQFNPGDTIYVSSSPNTVTGDDVTWYELNVNDTLLYASMTYIHSVPNRNYASNDENVNVVMLSGLISYIPLCTPWVLLVLTVILFILTFFVVTPDKESFIGEIRNSTGMRPFFVFSLRPYEFVSGLVVRFLVSAIISVAFILLLGCLLWAIMWILNILMWIILGCAIALAIYGVVLFFGGNVKAGVLAVIIGAVVFNFRDNLISFGHSCAATGNAFFDAFNIFSYVWKLVVTYWKTALLISAAPLALFIALALLILLVAGLLILYEKVTTSIYNIKHPCPFCHNPSEPAIYLSENEKLPIKLRPGMYGLLHVTHPATGERMPTTLLNGRDHLKRLCPHCNRVIKYHTGVERNIAFVGLPESGKTCLTYRFIGNLMRSHPGVEFTDKIGREAKTLILDIKNGKEQDLASKTSVNDMRRSLQILVPGKAPLPYHFFINDVGGELFTNSGVEANYVQFFKDAESISILIDPFTMDVSDYEISGDFATWYRANFAGGSSSREKLSNVIQTVKAMSDQFMHDTKNIHLNMILVKADTGYVSSHIMDDEAGLKDFVMNQMGLTAEVMDLEQTYASLHFYAVSALKNRGIDRLISGILEDLKVKL